MTKIIPVVANNGFSQAAEAEVLFEQKPNTPHYWMKGPGFASTTRRVDANQLTSLSAMIAYAAARSGQSEFGIERSLSDRFGVPNAKMLSAAQFEDAIRYLVDKMPS